MRNILIFLAALIVTTAAVEVFLYYTRIAPPTLKYFDDEYGSLNRHNIAYYKSVEGLFIGNANYDGRFRENYPPRKADKTTLRIMLMGDSFAEGIDVFPHNHFAQYIEDSLGKKLNRKVEVLNCGRGNATLHSMAFYFLTYIRNKYDVDILLMFTEGRDIYNVDGGYGYPSTFYKLDTAGNIERCDSWKNSPDYKLSKKLTSIPVLRYYDKSSFFRLLYRAKSRVSINGFNELTFGKFFEKPHEQNYSYDASNEAVSTLTKKLYDTLYRYDKGQVVYVLRDKPTYTPCIEKEMIRNNYQYINLADTFNGFFVKGTKKDAYYFKATQTYGGHWNNDGHKAVGMYLVNQLYARLKEYKMPDYRK